MSPCLPCFSPDGFPGPVFQDFADGPEIPANAPAIPLFPGSGIPSVVEFVSGDDVPVAASLRMDDVLPWVLVEPAASPLPGDTLVVTFEDDCRAELEVDETRLWREFAITEEAPLPETIGDVRFEPAIVGDGCETSRAIVIDVALPRAFVAWRASLTATLAAIPTGEMANDPIDRGASVTLPYLLGREPLPEGVSDADGLTLTYTINPQCSGQASTNFLAPGRYELELTAQIAGTETTLGPALGVLVVPESACAPCENLPPGAGEDDNAEDTASPPAGDHDEADTDDGGEGCRTADPSTPAAMGLVVLLLAGARRRSRHA